MGLGEVGEGGGEGGAVHASDSPGSASWGNGPTVNWRMANETLSTQHAFTKM